MDINREQIIRNIISDDENILKELDNAPHTYNSILREYKDNGTFQQILRRRLKRLCKDNDVYKLRIPGTRFGMIIFFSPNSNYKILTSQTLTRVRIFYMYDYINDEKNIILNNYWELKTDDVHVWQYSDIPHIIPKYSLREGGFRIWE